LLVGAAGVAVGLASGVGLARLMLPVIATTTALASKLTVPSARFVVGWSSLAIAAALGLGATLLAAALPAWRAARASTAAVIGGRGVEQPAHATRLVHIALAASLVAGSAAILLERWTRAASLGLVAAFLLAIGAAFAARPPPAVLPRVWLWASASTRATGTRPTGRSRSMRWTGASSSPRGSSAGRWSAPPCPTYGV